MFITTYLRGGPNSLGLQILFEEVDSADNPSSFMNTGALGERSASTLKT